jgi:hypothetical protein
MAVAASEAAGTARAVFAQDFLLKLEGPDFPAPFSFGPAHRARVRLTSDLLLDQVFDDLPGRGLPCHEPGWPRK